MTAPRTEAPPPVKRRWWYIHTFQRKQAPFLVSRICSTQYKFTPHFVLGLESRMFYLVP